jgi:hypothetical protein
MVFTTEEPAPIAEQMAKMCVQKLRAAENRQILVLEEGLHQGMKELGRMVLGRSLGQAEEEKERELACQCGGTQHYQRKREAKIKSLFGWISYERR